MAYTAIASRTLSTTTGTVDFNNIPGTFRDLVLVVDAIHSTAGALALRFNDDTGFNYFFTTAVGDGSGTAAYNFSDAYLPSNTGLNTSTRYLTQHQILDYSTTNKHKPVLFRWNDAGVGTLMGAGRWANTSAITKITVFTQPFQAGSTFSLYGVSA